MAFHRWAFHNGMLTIIGIGRIKLDVQVPITSLWTKRKIFRKRILNYSVQKQGKHYCCMAIQLNNFILLLKISKLFQWRIYSILQSSLLNNLCSITDYQKK